MSAPRIVIEIIDDSDFSRARKGDERPSCMWENNNKRCARGDRWTWEGRYEDSGGGDA